MSPPDDRPLRATDGPRVRSRGFPVRRMRGGGPELPRAPSQLRAAPGAAEARTTMFNQQQQLQQLQQQQLQQQQLLQLQQLLQQSPPQPPLPMAVSRGLPQQQPQQQLLNLQGASPASLLNGSVLQRALLLQQLQGNLRGYNLPTPNLTGPSLTVPQLATPNLQQFFPQATRQSLLGAPPVGVPINPSQINLSGRTPQKQARTPSSTTPNRKDSSSQTVPMEDKSDPPEGSEEVVESRTDTPEDQDSPPCPDGIAKEKHTVAPEPESCEASEPPAKRSKSLGEGTYPQVQPPEQPPGQPPVQPPDRIEGQPQTWPQVSMPASEQAPVPVRSTVPETPPDPRDAGAGLKEASPEPGGSQVSVESQEELTSGLDVGECEKRAREMLGVWGAGGSLKVTILQSSDSRAFSTVPLTPVPRAGDSTSATPASASTPSKQTLQFFCYLCKASCSSQQAHPSLCWLQEFQDHMAGAQHQQRLGEIQHMSQACLLSLLPVPRDVLEREDEEPPPRRWCNTCQVYYMGDLIQHRRTQDHKIAKQSLRPFCTVCNRYFKTPRKFVEHVKSQGHKDKAKELKMLEKEIAGQDEDHFITVDAVGCFEGDEVRSRDISIEEWKGSETYSPSTAYGVDFLVPVMGYICRICHKFYHSNSGAQLSHCKSLAHFENLQKYKKAKNPSPTSRPVSRRCAINARNALTALFTSGGRAPTQPSTQDTAKTPSKNASTTTAIQGPAQNASSKKPSLVSTRNHHSLLHGHS
ncbi:cip1-interacting zinc finger protein [Puma concolor]|uniref:Cip1-interacting zinc finger protein n=1 Tax=Puma concolor TaxID=9696 RepID=A0A6P6H1F1_PUMCO|nr:cip1-interacting zinc finger protein [Puma concolor]